MLSTDRDRRNSREKQNLRRSVGRAHACRTASIYFRPPTERCARWTAKRVCFSLCLQSTPVSAKMHLLRLITTSQNIIIEKSCLLLTLWFTSSKLMYPNWHIIYIYLPCDQGMTLYESVHVLCWLNVPLDGSKFCPKYLKTVNTLILVVALLWKWFVEVKESENHVEFIKNWENTLKEALNLRVVHVQMSPKPKAVGRKKFCYKVSMHLTYSWNTAKACRHFFMGNADLNFNCIFRFGLFDKPKCTKTCTCLFHCTNVAWK